MKILDLKNYNVYKENVPIIKNVSFSINKGDIFCIFGKNGSGKSTLAESIIGSNKYIVRGDIFYFGQRINNLKIWERSKKGILLQWQKLPSLDGITVFDYLKLSTSDINRIEESMNLVGLNPNKYFNRFVDDHLSGGERKRIEIASLYCAKPKLAIFDEPDSGIDEICLKKIENLILKLNKEGTTIILITHRSEIAESIGNKGCILCNGQIIHFSENVSDLINRYNNRCCLKKGCYL